MDLRLTGKRAFVSGSSSGIGAQIAVTLAQEGVAVVTHGLDVAGAETTARDVEALGARAAVVSGDLTVAEEIDAICRGALEAFGGIDILVNNAGGPVRADNVDWMALSPEDWQKSFQQNATSVFQISKAMAPGMIERGWGRIINITSLSGQMVGGFLHDYAGAKAAIDNFTINLSKTLAPQGVTVNAIAPGTVKTAGVGAWLAMLKERHGWSGDAAEIERKYATEYLARPVPRLGQTEEIASAVAFLASPRSDYTTGAILRIDGGAATSR